MLRFLLQYLLPLVLPFLIWFGYVALSQGRSMDWLDRTPWVPLAIAGVVLLAISLVTWSLMTGAPREAIYVPPRFEDGQLVPGHTIEPD